MAEFVPFRGLLYNTEKIGELSGVIAPPYDVISPPEQEKLYANSPFNIIRLIFGKHLPEDNETINAHSRAAAYFNQWIESRILVRDSLPAFYLTAVNFEHEGRQAIRWGIIGLVRLEPFSKGIVLPHERTFSKVKSERLSLMKACHANFSPVFGLFGDSGGILEMMKTAAATNSPERVVIDGQGLRHRLWRIQDPVLCDRISQLMKTERIYIADGHHRYETALNYKEWVKADQPDFNEHHPANFMMISLSSMADPGLVIWPAHRVLRFPSSQCQMDRLLEKLPSYFDIRKFTLIGDGMGDLGPFLKTNCDKNAFGMLCKGEKTVYGMTLKSGVMSRLFANEQPAALLDLDVTVLTRLVMMDLLGYDQEQLDDEHSVAYRSRAAEALESVVRGEGEVAFILNPTRMEQVQRVAEEGLIMPRKSTYFYPKVISGHVLNPLTQ